RNEKLYKAGARSSVTLAAQNADRRAAVSEIELALSTLTGRCAVQEPDIQLATFGYWITLSARNSSDCEIVIPSVFAVLKLMTSSNFAGCSIGKSPGVAPFNIRSTKPATCRYEATSDGP